jgi:hypothetical protein
MDIIVGKNKLWLATPFGLLKINLLDLANNKG